MSIHYEPLKKRADLKEEAKVLLKGKWVNASVFVFIAMILTSIGSAFSNIFMMLENGMAFFILFYLAYTCLIGYVFAVSMIKYFKKIGDGEHADFSELTKPFSYYSDVVIFTLVTILIACLPTAAVLVISLAFHNTYFWGILIAVLCLALIPVSLIYETWVYYVMLDLGEAPLKEVMARAFFLAKKSWFQFIILSLSFIGWYIVGMCVCGIGMYVVFPYHLTTLSLFHKNLKAHYFGIEISDEPQEEIYNTYNANNEELQEDNNTEENGEDF